MGGKTELVKGRINEVAGVLTGYDQLRAEGKLDQAVGKVEMAMRKVDDKVKKATRKAVDKVMRSWFLMFMVAMSAAIFPPGSIVLADKGGGGGYSTNPCGN